MDKQVLVTYATKYGATAEIAEKISLVLRQANLTTDVLPVKTVKDLTNYQAVVLGSAVYMGQWRKEATKFLQTHEARLAQQQVWIFSSGPTGEGDPVELLKGWRLPSSMQPVVDRIRPREIVVFHGNVNLDKLNLLEKTLIKNVNALSGDYRNWEAITTWAEGIAKTLAETATN